MRDGQKSLWGRATILWFESKVSPYPCVLNVHSPACGTALDSCGVFRRKGPCARRRSLEGGFQGLETTLEDWKQPQSLLPDLPRHKQIHHSPLPPSILIRHYEPKAFCYFFGNSGIQVDTVSPQSLSPSLDQ